MLVLFYYFVFLCLCIRFDFIYTFAQKSWAERKIWKKKLTHFVVCFKTSNNNHMKKNKQEGVSSLWGDKKEKSVSVVFIKGETQQLISVIVFPNGNTYLLCMTPLVGSFEYSCFLLYLRIYCCIKMIIM